MIKMKTLLSIIILLSFISCNYVFSYKGSGNIIKEDRDINTNFTGVIVSNHGDLFIEIGDQVKLTIKGDDNIIPYIKTEISNNILKIKSGKKIRNGFRSRKGIKYYLTVKKGQLSSLKATSHGDISIPELIGDKIKITLTSHGDVEVDKIEAKKVEFSLTSHGDLEIGDINADFIKSKQTSHSEIEIKSGIVKNQDLYLTSHGDYLAKNVKSLNCKVKITSHGKVVVFCNEVLDVKITSHGDLYYRGKPDLTTDIGKHGTLKSID